MTSARSDVAVVTIGDELLRGSVIDTNLAWLGRSLLAAGLRVVAAQHCPDARPAIAAAVRWALSEASTIVVTGGLGPTSDDLTRQALADLVSDDLVVDTEARRRLDAYAETRPGVDVSLLASMATRPRTAELIGNALGSAPGIRLEVAVGADHGVVFAVPGVPREMEAMVTAEVIPQILAELEWEPRPWSRTWYLPTLRESDASRRLEGVRSAIDELRHAHLSYLATPGLVQVGLNAPDVNDESAQSLEGIARRIDAALVPDAMARPPEQEVVGLLQNRGLSLGCAESLTGGGVSASITSVPGSSAVLRGGVVAYGEDAKRDLLGVPGELLAMHGAVSVECAAAMAAGARDRLQAAVAVSTTGVAGPDLQEGRPRGEVYLAVAHAAGVRTRSLRLRGDRSSVRRQTVVHALDLVWRTVSGHPDVLHGPR